jgi:hypothetical protein
MFLRAFDPKKCFLCGATGELTGEHKIKASAIRSEFGSEKMVIGRFGEPDGGFRSVQGPKSKNLHFEAKVCRTCNSTRTQAADREFDRFNRSARELLDNGKDPAKAFGIDRYEVGSQAYLNVFRYFAKLLCCHVAEINGPIPMHMANFAIGQVDQNCVWLAVDKDVTYVEAVQKLGEHQYAAHGGLVVYGDKNSGEANAFHSTLTVGPLRYVFHSRLNWIQRLELRWVHHEFRAWAKERVAAAQKDPIPEQDKRRLGL